MRAQNFLGDKNSNLRLSDQFWATKDVTYIYVSTSELRDSFHSLKTLGGFRKRLRAPGMARLKTKNKTSRPVLPKIQVSGAQRIAQKKKTARRLQFS